MSNGKMQLYSTGGVRIHATEGGRCSQAENRLVAGIRWTARYYQGYI
jgi:hypothetical protein